MGVKVPDVLISGNHKKIDEWRKNKSLEETKLEKELEEKNMRLEKGDIIKTSLSDNTVVLDVEDNGISRTE